MILPIILGINIGFLGAISTCNFSSRQPNYNSSIWQCADKDDTELTVEWKGEPGNILVKICNEQEIGIPDIDVELRSDSGWSHGITDTAGISSPVFGERELLQLNIEGKEIINEQQTMCLESIPRRLLANNGLMITVIRKDKTRFRPDESK